MCYFVWMHKVFVLFLVSIYYKIGIVLSFLLVIHINIYINIYKQYVKSAMQIWLGLIGV